MPINPAQLDRRLTFQALSEGRDAAGGVSQAWADERTVWGQKVEQGTSEFVSAGVLKAETNVLFRVRWWADLREGKKYRIVCEGKTYEITGINEIGRRELWQIQARGELAAT